jgi:positive regulator of sigma E activity
VGFQSSSIIKYLEPLIGDLFMAWFADSIFDEEHLPALGETLSTKMNAVK